MAPEVGLSVEPDVVLVLTESLTSGRVRLISKHGDHGPLLEVEGAVDLVVECVSNSSVREDTKRLVDLYARAGIREYWVVDARSRPPVLRILRGTGAAFDEVVTDPQGYARSEVLGASARLVRLDGVGGIVRYRLDFTK